MRRQAWLALLAISLFAYLDSANGQATKLVMAYASPAATFCPGWIARREGVFAKYNIDVDMVLMQGASTYMAALASGNIQVLYGGGTAVSRAIATAGFDLAVIATETRYIPLRLMVVPSIRTPADLKGKKLGVGRAGLDEYFCASTAGGVQRVISTGTFLPSRRRNLLFRLLAENLNRQTVPVWRSWPAPFAARANPAGSEFLSASGKVSLESA